MPSASDAINTMFFNIDTETALETMRGKLLEAQEAMVKMLKQIYRLEHSKSLTFSDRMWASLASRYPGLILNTSEMQYPLCFDFRTSELFHFGHQDDEVADPVFYVTYPMYLFRLGITQSFRLSIRNMTGLFSQLGYSRLLSKVNYDPKREYWAHPHVSRDGEAREPFEHMCYGNNRFYQYLNPSNPDSITPGNILMLLRGFCIWAQHVNVLDMYGTSLYPAVTLNEDELSKIDAVPLFKAAQEWRNTNIHLPAIPTGISTTEYFSELTGGLTAGPITAFHLSYALFLRQMYYQYAEGSETWFPHCLLDALDADIAIDTITSMESRREEEWVDHNCLAELFSAPLRLKEYMEQAHADSPRSRAILSNIIPFQETV